MCCVFRVVVWCSAVVIPAPVKMAEAAKLTDAANADYGRNQLQQDDGVVFSDDYVMLF